jgi:hypothetical protein
MGFPYYLEYKYICYYNFFQCTSLWCKVYLFVTMQNLYRLWNFKDLVSTYLSTDFVSL